MTLWDKILGKKSMSPRLQPTAAPSTDAASESRESRDGAATQDRKAPVPAEENNVKGADNLIAPHTTEKTTDFSARGIYVFKVAFGANKRTIAEAVAGRYGVAVDCVRMAVQPPKQRRRGQQIGWKHGFKKAMVQLKEGHKIDTQ